MAAARSRRTLVVIIADLVLSTLAGWPEAAGRAEVIARRTGRPVLLVGDRSRAAPQRFAGATAIWILVREWGMLPGQQMTTGAACAPTPSGRPGGVGRRAISRSGWPQAGRG